MQANNSTTSSSSRSASRNSSSSRRAPSNSNVDNTNRTEINNVDEVTALSSRNKIEFDRIKLRTNLVNINDLVKFDVKRKKTRVELQLLRVIAGKKNETDKYSWMKKKGGLSQSGSGKYSRMYMFRDLNAPDGKVTQMN